MDYFRFFWYDKTNGKIIEYMNINSFIRVRPINGKIEEVLRGKIGEFEIKIKYF
jgi:competence protein ComGF